MPTGKNRIIPSTNMFLFSRASRFFLIYLIIKNADSLTFRAGCAIFNKRYKDFFNRNPERVMLKHIAVFFLAFAALCLLSVQLSAQTAATAKCAHCQKERFVSVQAKTGSGKQVPLCYECAMLPRCDYCQMPSEAKTDGGDHLCRECAKDTIKEKTEAEKVMKDVRQVLTAKFRMTSKHKILHELGTRKELNLEADGEHNELGWFDPKTIRNKPQYTIRILTGLPRDVFRSVGAHELAHDWMNEQLPHLMDKPEIREGFAEFVAWSFSKAEGNKRMMEYTENRTDEVYGGGFRKVRAMMGEAKTADEWKKILLKEFPLKGKKNGK